jgi:hypothetical protein
MSDHVRLFDLQSGDELAALPQGGQHVAFQASDALVTNAAAELLRWPIKRDSEQPSRLQIGPPVRLHFGSYVDIDCDAKGEVTVQAAGSGAFVLRPGKSTKFLGPHADGRHVSISPDGRYVATGNHHGEEGVKVWDCQTGKLIIRLPAGGMCGALWVHGRANSNKTLFVERAGVNHERSTCEHD